MTQLTVSDLKHKRSWIFWLGTIICLSAAVISAALNAFAVQWFMPHGPAQILGIAASVVLDAWKVLTPVLVSILWQGRMRRGAILCALVGVIPFAISFLMAASFSVVTRADAVTQRTAATESRQELRAELQRQESQLKALGVQRPVAAVEAELQSQAVPPSIWRDSNECHVLNSDYWQRACRDVVRIRKELAAARSYEKSTGRIGELRLELTRTDPVSTDIPLARLITALTGFNGEIGVMWFSVAFAAAIEIVAGLGLAFVQMTNHAQWLIRQRDLMERVSSVQLGAIDVPSSEPQSGCNSVAPNQQLSFQPKAKDPTLAKVSHDHDPVKPDVEPSLQPDPKISPPGELEEHSNSVKLSLQPTQPSSPVQPSLPPTQPSSPVQPILQPSQPGSRNAADGVLSNPVQANRTPSAEHDAAQVAENRTRHKLGVVKLGNPAKRNSECRSEEETTVRAFLAQLSVGPGRKTQAAELHREYLRRARVQGWPMLNSTAFGRLMTMQVKELGFEKRKEGKVTMYYGVGIALESKVEPRVAA
jgi:hypothetical protein